MNVMRGNTVNMRLVAENDELTVRVSALAALLEASAGGLDEYIEVYQNLLGKIAEEAVNAGYSGIYELCQYYRQGLSSLARNTNKLNGEECRLLSEWPNLILAYLAAPADPQTREALVTHLRYPGLALPVSDGDAAILTAMLDEGPSISDDTPTTAADSEIVESFSDEFEIIIEAPDEQTTELADGVLSSAGGTSLPSQELIVTLLNQLTVMQEPLDKLLAVALSEETSADEFQSAVDIYAGYLQRFAKASEEIGLIGLYQVSQHVCDNLRRWVGSDNVPLGEMADVLNNFVTRTRSYLLAPYVLKNGEELVNCACAGDWPHPLSSEEARVLLPLFQNYTQPADNQDQIQPETDSELEEGSKRPRVATAEDVSLELPEDVESDLFEIMLEELPEQTAQFSEAVQNLIAGGTLEDVKVAQRMAHSLKGAGNTIGIKGIANLTHHLEDILIKFSKQKILPTRTLSLTMMNVVDCLEGMGEALNGNGTPPEDARVVLQEVLDWANRIDREGLPKEDDDLDVVTSSDNLSVLSDSLSSDSLSISGIAMRALSDSLSSSALSASGAMRALPDSMAALPALPARQQSARRKNNSKDSPSAMVRVPAKLIDNLLRLAGEATIMTGLMRERVRQTVGQVQSLQSEFNRMHSLGGELERLIDIKDFSAAQQSGKSYSDFDALEMDQYNELHTYSRMLAETATDSQELGYQVKQELRGLEDMLVDHDMLNRETQDAVMDVRMVPVKTIVSKLQRSVRQTARLTNKQVKLQVNGEDTHMDGDVLADLADPLMHLLRNAVDHGIESPEQRIQSGKEAEGNILLEFHREGNSVVVRCRDDGGGINFDAIQRKAESLGILQLGQQVSKDDLKRILLLSNFSTRDEVTQTSGRGVGMDAVYSRVIEMGGSLALESETGVGTLFELRVPLTLITSHALLVRQGPSLLAISDHGVMQILYGQDGVIEQEGDSVFYQLGEERYPARFLETILQLPPDRRASDRSKRPVFLVQDEMGITAVIVGEVLESLSVVVKGFGHYVSNLIGIAGAAILGDGSIKPVIDLPDLLHHARLAQMPMIMIPAQTEALQPDRAMVMVVDDSRSARHILTRVIEAAGYIVRPARDGMEAIKLLESRPADIVLSDMEMPRMNGIELTEHMRMNSQLSHIPVIMITSRSTKKHREEAETAGVNGYFTKPFDEEGLVSAVEALLAQMKNHSKTQIQSEVS